MDFLEERLGQVDWWIPGMRDVEGILFLLWLVVIPCLALRGCIGLLSLWNARRNGEFGTQRYLWRSSERFEFPVASAPS
jgi:hypothetical protein